MTYKVTLTHKVKLEVEAETPEEALTLATKQVEGQNFEPTTWSVKEIKESEE